MKKGKILTMTSASALAVIVLLAGAMRASANEAVDITGQHASDIQEAINDASNRVYGSGGIVTVIGSATLGIDAIDLRIPSGVTVRWQAELTASSSGTLVLLYVGAHTTNGGGAFDMAGGFIRQNGAISRALQFNGVTGTISNGTVSAIDGVAVIVSNTSTLTVNGGTIFSTSESAISASGNVTVNDGTIYSISYHAIRVPMASSLTVTGGTIYNRTSTQNAIRTDNPTASSISGGFVFSYGTSATDAVSSSLPVTSSGVVVAWNQGAGNTSYTSGTTADLSIRPAVTAAAWGIESGKSGIRYNNGTQFFDMTAMGITVNYPPIVFNNQTLPNGTVGTSYSANVTPATGGSGSFTYSATLPAGLSMNASGAISGTPNAAVTGATFTVTAKDAVTNLTADATYTLTVNLVAPTITTTSLQKGTLNTSYSQTLTATGTAPITWSLVVSGGALPDGLSLASGTGVISGTPSVVGTFNFRVKAENSAGNNERNLSIAITEFGDVPPTGLADMTAWSIAMYTLIVMSLMLWGYVGYTYIPRGKR